MTIFINIMKRLFKNKCQFLLMFILPIIIVIPILTETAETPIRLGVCDLDGTAVSKGLVSSLKINFNVMSINKDDINKWIKNDKVNYAIVIDKGYTDSIISGKAMSIEGYENSKIDIHDAIGASIDSFINPVNAIAKSVNGNSDAFYKSFNEYTKGHVTLSDEPVKKIDPHVQKMVWGIIVLFLLYSSIFSSSIICSDKENGTFYRTISAPIRLKNYMFQNILCFLSISFVQIAVLSFLCVYAFNVTPGKSVWNMILLLTVFSLVSVSMGIAISSLSNSTIKANVFGFSISVLFSFAGGIWGDVTLPFLKSISDFIPVTWVMDGVKKLVANNSLSSVRGDIFIMILFAVVFFMLGTWRKEKIA